MVALPRHSAVLVLAATLWVAGCRTGIVYSGDEVPVYSGRAASATQPIARGDTVLVAAFNIKYARRIDRALDVIHAEPVLRDADVLLLQEMDEPGTRRIAESLGLNWVYYPAVRHTRTGRDFGNAVLTRWPIVEHERLLLPHRGRITGTRRAATAATVDVGGRRLRVYSVHLATMLEVGPQSRADQLCAIADDALEHELAIIGGDLNSSLVAEALDPGEWAWPTATGPPTVLGGRLDHILIRGLEALPGRAGVIRDVRGASDHRPIWVEAVVRR